MVEEKWCLMDVSPVNVIPDVSVIPTVDVIQINCKCNSFLTVNVILFLTANVIPLTNCKGSTNQL